MSHHAEFVEVFRYLHILQFLPIIGFWSPNFDSWRYRPKGYWETVTSKFNLGKIEILLEIRGGLLRLTLRKFLGILQETSPVVFLRAERRGKRSAKPEAIPIGQIGIRLELSDPGVLNESHETVPLGDFREWLRGCGKKMENFHYTIPAHFLSEPIKREMEYEAMWVPVVILPRRKRSELNPSALARLMSGKNRGQVELSFEEWRDS